MAHTKSLSSYDFATLDVEGGSSSTLSSESNYFEGLPILTALRRQDQATNVQYWTSRGPQQSATNFAAGSFSEPGASTSRGLLNNLLNLVTWIQAGFRDSVRFNDVAGVVAASSAIRISIAKGLLLSVAVVLLIFFFELAFFPAQLYPRADGVQSAGQSLTQGNGNVLWLYPVIAISYFVASSWTLDVAQTAYKLRHSHLRNLSLATFSPKASSSLRRRICQESFRLLLILNYLVIVLALQRLPYSWLGRSAAFLFMSFVDAFYCFDPVLTSRGWTVERRMRFVEEKWAYMTAFGILPTLVSFFHPSGLLNLFLFMLVYPFYTVLALLANPQPRGNTAKSSAGPFVPRRLPFFFPTAVAYRWIMRFAPPADGDDGLLGLGHSGISRLASATYGNHNSNKVGVGVDYSSRPAWNTYHGTGTGAIDNVPSAFPAGTTSSSSSQASGVVPFATANGTAHPQQQWQTNGGRKTAAQFVGGVWGSNQNAGTMGGTMRWGAASPVPPASPQLGGSSTSGSNFYSQQQQHQTSAYGYGSTPTSASAQAQAQELTIPASFSHPTAATHRTTPHSIPQQAEQKPSISIGIGPPPKGSARRPGKKMD